MSVATLKDLLQSKLIDFAEKDAFIILESEDKKITLSFNDLDVLSTNLSSQLNKKTELGDRILVILPPGDKYITALFASFYSGLTAVPVYPPNPAAIEQSVGLISSIGIDSGSKIIITNKQIQGFLLSLKDKFSYFIDVQWHLIDEEVKQDDEKIIRDDLTKDTLALLLYTSGSTGAPKGVMLSHGNLVHNAKVMSENCHFSHEDKFCIWLPPYHVSGLFSGIILSMYSGATNILFSPLQFVENPFKWLKTISDYKATVSGSPTFAYDICNKVIPQEKLSEIDLSSWKSAVVGGEAVKRDVLNTFIEKFSVAGFRETTFHTMFGLTESTMISTGRGHQPPEYKYISRKKLEDNIAEEINENVQNGMYLTCSGSALNEINVITVDPENLIPSPDNTVGEIWVSGGSVAKGYWKKAEETEKTFNAFTNEANPQGPFLRTGDFGFFTDGKLFVTGRMKEVVIVRGVNHYPEDIEKTIKSAFSVTDFIEASVFQTEIDKNEELIVALELSPNLKDNLDSTISIIKKEIAKNHGLTPHGFVILSPNELPRTVTRKIQRKQCGKNVYEGKWNLSYTSKNNDYIISDKKDLPKPDLNNPDLQVRKEEINNYIKALFAEKIQINQEEISDNTVLSLLGLDSIFTVNLITEIRNDLQVNVPVSKFFDETTVSTLSEFINNSLSGIEESIEEIDFAKEYSLPSEIKNSYNYDIENFKCENIFLTGATGFLGGYLLNNLLNDTNSTIYCLVRAKNKEEGLKRLKNNLEKTHRVPLDFEKRVIPVLGDLTTKQLGIDDNEFEELSEKIDVICHNGASVNFVAPYASIKSANVESTRELLKLSVKNKLKPLHFVSTLAVFNSSDRNDYPGFYEDMTNPYPENLFGGYPTSKYISEMLLLEAQNKGLPVTIHRPGLITGDSNNGYTNLDDFFCRLIKGCLELKVFPDLNFDLDMTPVNYVSDAISLALTKEESINKTFHLMNHEPIKFADFTEWIIDSGYKAEVVPYEQWLKTVQSAKSDNALYPLLPFISEKHTPDKITFLEMYAQEKSPKFDSSNTDNLLKNSEIKCHSANGSLLALYFKFFKDIKFL